MITKLPQAYLVFVVGMNSEDLRYFQSMPLDIKVAMTKTRIREWVTHFGVSGTYVSFSGGKDSTVLLHIVRELYPDIKAVFVNTGLEYPEIREFAKSFDNVKVLYPKMQFDDVIRTYGYPFISKEISQVVYEGRLYNSSSGKYKYRIDQLNGNRTDKNGNPSRFNYQKYKPLLYTDFIISNRCCDVMKKTPAKQYEHESEKTPFIASMASESALRTQKWLEEGCNAFDSKRQTSKPMSFWTENDVLQYIKQNGIKIASVYGEVINADSQMSMFEDETCRLCTTGCDRTGCIFCGFGAHLDKYSRFLRLKETHPKQYRYCIEGGEYDIDGIWKPNKAGLGMGHVIDELNKLYSKNGKAFIEY